MTASRAYEANLKVLQTLRQQLEQTLACSRANCHAASADFSRGRDDSDAALRSARARRRSRAARLRQRLRSVLGSAVQSDQQAGAAVRDLATGQTDNLHGVLLQVAQADLSFRLILEIRNRLTMLIRKS